MVDQTSIHNLLTSVERQARSRSFIIYGLPELDSENFVEMRFEDFLAAQDICIYLGVTMPFGPYAVRRLNYFNSSSRPLLVHLNSVEDCQLLLSRKSHLHFVPDTCHLELESTENALQMAPGHVMGTPRTSVFQ